MNRTRCHNTIKALWIALLGCTSCWATADGPPPELEPEFADARPTDLPTDASLVALGATIGRIDFDRRGVFDTSKEGSDHWVFRAANRMHHITRESVIRSQLLFAPGDEFDPRELRESERILRSNQFFFDAAVVPMRYTDGVVDIRVTTRDLWSIEPALSLKRSGGQNQTVFGLEDENFLGTGALLGAQVERDLDRDSTLIYFADRQIGERWISVGASYANNSDGSRKTLTVTRPFFALDTRWAAGITLVDDDREDSLYRRGDEVLDYYHDERFIDAWGGWSAGLKNGWVRRWRAGVVAHDNQFAPPPDGIRAGVVPSQRKLVYPYVGIDVLEDNFIKASNVEQMARTEDFYLGTRFSASVGYAGTSMGSDRSAWMLSGSAQRGFGSAKKRMLLLEAGTSGRRESNNTANAIVRTSARYYHRLSPKWLRFVTLRATKGINLDLDQPLQLGGDTGLRGYPVRYQSGDSSVVFSVEQRYFTDWYPWEIMRVGGAVFFDMGRTFGNNPVGGESEGWLRNIGFGLRLAPTRGGRKVFHLDVAFPLDGDSSIDGVQISLDAKRSF